MALVPVTSRDANGNVVTMLFDDSDPDGLTPVSKIPDTINATLVAPVEAEFTDYPGLTDEELRAAPVPVLDGTAGYTITQTTITLTGSSQQALAANVSRKGVGFADAGAANDIRIQLYGGAASATDSPLFPPGSTPITIDGPWCPKGAINVIGTAGQKLVVWEAV